MKRNLLYISLLSQQDLDDIDALIHIHAGSGIIISKTSDGLEISIDLLYLNYNLINSFIWRRE